MTVRKLCSILQRLLVYVFFALVIGGFFVDYPFAWWLLFAPLVLSWAAGIAAGRSASRELAVAPRAPVEVRAPVTGRWSALNSPADKIPSHGVHVYGQTYAIDIVAEDERHPRPGFTWLWPLARRPERYPAFGADLVAVADATVVRAEDGQRDHLSRSSLFGVLYLLLAEGELRGLAGARRVVGNHVILDLGDGTYAAYAHVQRGSLAVRPGERVRAGQTIGRCGNSGNSSEPHVHFQLMDGPDLDSARGVPFRWAGVGVPANGEEFTVAEESAPAA
ncbi:murein hydrolase activator EnvC family protein [Streptomyces sp. G45]|uniref:murein hydrolase activator EnvC family protein n=1 Tax=Streptomyces sp. G45 TaxID=3406627 RepID=UPI003C16472D